jgi:urea transport system substrate-binding protein
MAVSRRELVIGAAAVAATATVGRPVLAQSSPLRIGVFQSEQDANGVDEMVAPYMSQMRLGLQLAANEINAAGGIRHRPVELFYRNDLGSPPDANAVTSIVKNDQAEAIVSGFVQASPRLITVRSPSPVPVLSGFWNDAAYCGPVTKSFAPTVRQIVPAIVNYLPAAGRDRPFTITNWTPSGRDVSTYLSGALGVPHVGDALVTTPWLDYPAGDFRGVLRWANDIRANLIFVAEPRPYSVNVVNQAAELGITVGKTFAYVDFSELQAARLATNASIVTCLPFVASDPSPGVQDFVRRARAAGGTEVTHVAFTHYNAIMALKAAMDKAGEASAAGAIAGFRGGVTIDTATGPLTLEPGGYSTMNLFIATAGGGGPLKMVQMLKQVASGATCSAA